MNVGVALLFRSLAVRSFDWQLRLFPRFPTTGNIPKLIEPVPLQNARGDAGAIAAPAVNRGRFVAIKLSQPFAKLRDINVMRSRNMPPSPLTGRTHIDDLQRRSPLIQLVDAHLSDSFQQKSRRVPRFHPADQIPGEFRVSGPNK